MGVSKIEWTTYTFTPWIGCTKVDELCAHCYAESDDRRRKWTPQGWGQGKPRKRTSVSYWRLPLKWGTQAAAHPWYRCAQCHKAWGGEQPMLPQRRHCTCGGELLVQRPRVFCASLADWLDDDGVPAEWLADLLALIHATPNLDWLLLTKRPENWLPRMALATSWLAVKTQTPVGWLFDWRDGRPPANVWLGTSVGTQKSAGLRIPALVAIPARVRFLSCEPLLGPMDISAWLSDIPSEIQWVICGGESGPHARPMHPQWARDLRDQCAAAGVPFFMKQLCERGRKLPVEAWPADLNRRAFPHAR